METIPEAIRRRFLAKIERTEGCWLWTAATDKDGYGLFRPSQTVELWWPHERAHRFMYLLQYGLIPDSLLVLHTCDNPPCVNPGHLFLGTHQDNATDKVNKCRQYGYTGDSCMQGHLLSGDNLYINATSKQRVCKTCRRGYDRNRRKEGALANG